MPKTLLVVFYSKNGAIEKMAKEIARGATDNGANVVVKTVVDCTMTDLSAANAIAFGSPTTTAT